MPILPKVTSSSHAVYFLPSVAVDLARYSAFVVDSFLPFLSAAAVDLARNSAFVVGSFSSVLPIMTWDSNTPKGNIREREQLRKASMSIESHGPVQSLRLQSEGIHAF